MVQYPDRVEDFDKSFQDALSADHLHNSASEIWDHFWETIQKTSFTVFGKETSKNSDWFEAKSSEMTLVIEANCYALAEYKHSPSVKSLQALRVARSKVQRTSRRCANKYWQQLNDVILKTVNCLASSKAPGSDGISPDLF